MARLFAQKMDKLGTETAFEVLAKAKALEKQGRNIVHLEIGEPDFDTPNNIKEAAIKAMKGGYTHYVPAAGIPELRTVIAEYLSKSRGINVDPDQLRGAAHDDASRATRIALALHDLEARITPVAMDRGLRHYLRQWHGRHPRLADLRSALGEVSGQPAEVDRAFAQYIEGARTVDDRIASFTSHEVLPQPGFVQYRGRRLELTRRVLDRAIARKRQQWQRREGAGSGGGPFPYRTSVVVERNGARVPQVLQVQFADGSVHRVRWDTPQRVRHYTWLGRSPAIPAVPTPSAPPKAATLRCIPSSACSTTSGTSLKPAKVTAWRWRSTLRSSARPTIPG